MTALRAHPFFAPINWPTLWTDPAPPLETGLVRREGPQPGSSDWDDVGQAWDDLVGESSDDDGEDGIGWAPDADGAERDRVRMGARAAYEAGYVPPEDVGPGGELPEYARERIEAPPPPTPPLVVSGALALQKESSRDGAGSDSTLVVQGNGAVHFEIPLTVVPGVPVDTSPPDSVTTTATTVDGDSMSSVSTTEGSPDRRAQSQPAESETLSQRVGVPSKRVDTYATSSSDGSPVEKLGAALDAMRRGRHRTRSPMRASSQPPLEPEWCVLHCLGGDK